MALFGTLAVAIIGDASKFNQTMDEASKKSGSFGERFGSVAAGVGKAAVAGLAAAGAAFAGLAVKSLQLGGELEQNLGGMKAVFGDLAEGAWVGVDKFGRAVSEAEAMASGTFTSIEDVANQAFKNMGVSTSDYLATLNKMGALMQGSGLDTQASLDLSTQAMQRAADVASIMGIDIGAAMESVAGAAKGNFTMMDNLGVAMNATTLEAYALSKGVETTWKEMDNATKVSLAMEMFLDKTAYAAGNYTKENETLAGSLTTAKAAMQNFLSGAGDASAFIDAFSNAGDVIVKNLVDLLPRLVTGVTQIIQGLIPKMSTILATLLPSVIKGAEGIISGLVKAMPTMLSALAQIIPTIVAAMGKIAAGIVREIPTIIAAVSKIAPQIISTLAQGLGDFIPILKPITSAIEYLANNFESVLKVLIPVTSGFIGFKAAMSVVSTVEAFSKAVKAGEAAVAAASAVLATGTTIQGAFAAAATHSATAEAVRTAAKAAGMSVDAAGNLITAAGTAATTAETMAVLASSGALSAKTVIAGLLTGKIGLATAAQWLWNAAMAANPIGLVIAGVAALAAGIAGLVLWINRETEEQRELKRSTQDLVDSSNELTDSIKENKEAYAERGKEIEANVGASGKLADKVFDLIEEEKKLAALGKDTADIRKQIAVTVDAYNKSIGESVLLYNEEENSISKTREEIEKLMEARIAEAKQQAAQERLVEIYKEQIDTEIKRAQVREKIIELEEKQANKAFETVEAYGKSFAAVEKLRLEEAELTSTYDEQNDMVETIIKTMADYETAIDAVGEAQEETTLKVKTAADIQEEILKEREEAEQSYTDYLTEQANLRQMTLEDFTEYLGDDLVKRMAYIDEEAQHYLDVRDTQNAIAAERKAIEDDYTLYLMEQANLRGMALDEYTALIGENAIRNRTIIDDELNHAIDVRLAHEAILQQRTADEEAHTLAFMENAAARGMTVQELEQLQQDAADQVEAANQRIVGVYETMTASLGNVNEKIKLDSKTTWDSVQKNQDDMIAKTHEFSALYAQLIEAGVSESYLNAIGATGPESIPLLQSMIKAGTDEVKAKEGEWRTAYGTIQEGLVGSLSDDSETKAAISEYISGASGIGPSLKSELEEALKAADFANVAKTIPEGVGKGVTDNVALVTDAVTKMIGEGETTFHVAAKSNSPSELFAKAAEAIPEGAAVGIERTWNLVTNMITKLIAQAKSTTDSAVASNNFPSIGQNMIQGMINGANSMASALHSTMTNIATKAAQAARAALDIKSPSGVFRDIGQMTGLGFVEGVDEMGEAAREAVENLVALPDISQIAMQASDDWRTAGAAAPLDAGIASSAVEAQKQTAVKNGASAKSQNPIVLIVKSILDGHEIGHSATPYVSTQQGHDLNNALRAAGVMP